MDNLSITSPKRQRGIQTGWEAFFPYYAGFPEKFVTEILSSGNIDREALIFDPWNGSGTTTLAAARMGYSSIGQDINPAMIVVARARLLNSSEADSLEPIAENILASATNSAVSNNEPLLNWFDSETASLLRGIEEAICANLVGKYTLSSSSPDLSRLSSLAGTFYVALFAVCRSLASKFQSSNPTWIRIANPKDCKISVSWTRIQYLFKTYVSSMSERLIGLGHRIESSRIQTTLLQADSTIRSVQPGTVDLVITSPPYCTRIDYVAATRVELAVLSRLLPIDSRQLSGCMTGSTRVPSRPLSADQRWGTTCVSLLENIKRHPSKASNTYYLKIHLDYFDKMFRSIGAIREVLKPNAYAVIVVQDSYYKELHNDVPTIISEMATTNGLSICRRDNFNVRRSMSHINRAAKRYRSTPEATESVLCFQVAS